MGVKPGVRLQSRGTEMSIAFLFPGQGAQHPGMLHALPDHPAVARTIAEVSETLRQNMLDLDTADALRSTVSVQLALLASGVAAARALEEEGVAPLAVAGNPAGAFSAAVVAGALELRDAATLMRERGERMSELYPRGYGMAAIIGLSENQVCDLTRQVQPAQAQVYISGVNAPLQIVIASSDAGVDSVIESARKRGARKAERLDVFAPSHSLLLQPVAEALKKRILTMRLREPKRVYIANVTGRALRSAEAIAQHVAQNIAHPVHWYDAATVREEMDCGLFLEMPPGHTLSRLAYAAFAEVRALALAETSLEGAVQLAQGYNTNKGKITSKSACCGVTRGEEMGIECAVGGSP
jgi:malonate decarboxylase epsilon subunit